MVVSIGRVPSLLYFTSLHLICQHVRWVSVGPSKLTNSTDAPALYDSLRCGNSDTAVAYDDLQLMAYQLEVEAAAPAALTQMFPLSHFLHVLAKCLA